MYYYNDTWSLICDRDFDDMSARVVCRELGFVEGKAICCSAYGKTFDSILTGKSLKCSGSESSVSECLKDSQCDQYDTYASVMCFTPEDLRNETMMSGSKDFIFFLYTKLYLSFFTKVQQFKSASEYEKLTDIYICTKVRKHYFLPFDEVYLTMFVFRTDLRLRESR